MFPFLPRRWRRPTAIATVLVVLLGSVPASATFVRTDEPVPADRLIRNLKQHIRENPSDAEGLYALARVHSLVYAKAAFDAEPTERVPEGHVRVIPAERRPHAEGEPEKKTPGFAPYTTVQVGRGQGRPVKRSETARDHLLLSLGYYSQAVKADPEAALYRLGYGWMLEQAADFFEDGASADPSTGPTTGPSTRPTTVTAAGQPVSRPVEYRQRAIEQYRKVLELKLEEELEEETFLDRGPDTLLSREAAQGVLRLLDADDVQPEERGEVQRMKEAIAKLEAKPMAVTPLIFSLAPGQSFDDLLDPGQTTRFDLMGDGIERQWPWVKAQTALLVWDPQETGAITSGRQLFGSVTWWMFWDTAYDALAMLDDNRDGYLRGDELAGIAAWFDRNGNGVSDEGEVIPVVKLGVAAIRTRGVAGIRSDIAAWNEHGLEMTDGRILPTWDWRPSATPPAHSPGP